MKKVLIAISFAAMSTAAVAQGDGTDHVNNMTYKGLGQPAAQVCLTEGTCAAAMKVSSLSRAAVIGQLRGWTDPAQGDAS